MALNYSKCAQEILRCLGGRENILQVMHCSTRLRLVIKDNRKVDKKVLEQVEGVKGLFESNGQLQLIIGTGTVNKVYDEFCRIAEIHEESEKGSSEADPQVSFWKKPVKAIGDVFVPILPAIVASGLLMGIVSLLGNDQLVKMGFHFRSTDWYEFLNMIAGTAFSYLPVLIAISAARVFGGNVFLACVIGLMMVHGSLADAWNAADGYGTWQLFGNIRIGSYVLGSVNRLGYQGHVIPVILAVYLMCRTEKWLHRHVPEMLDLFVTPLTTVFVTALATFVVIGPVFSVLESYVLQGAKALIQNPLGALVMGACYPVTVVMGLHHMYNTIELGMLAVGQNTWMPIASAANFAQFGACLAVGLKAKNRKTKSVAIPASFSAALGITEPAVFGVNFRFMRPFFCAMAAGAAGAAVGTLFRIGAGANGVTGLPGYLIINHPGGYTILLAVSGILAFGLTWISWKEEEPEGRVEAGEKTEEKTEEKIEEETDEKIEEKIEEETDEKIEEKIEEKTEEKIEEETSREETEEPLPDLSVYAPVSGRIILREEIPDETFASGMLGDGVGIDPAVGEIRAPFDGEVSSILDTRHAMGLNGPEGMELLIHVGVDTVYMKGDGFELYVKEGEKIRKGQKLMSFDIDKIKQAGHSPVVSVLLTNSGRYSELHIEKYGSVNSMEKLYTIEARAAGQGVIDGNKANSKNTK